jgi:predicted RNA-binding protein with PIN domain
MKTLSVEPTATSDAAYQQAFAELNALKSMSARELNKELNISNFNIASKSTHLKDSGFITVQERMNADGQLEYVGTVNVKVHYAERDSNR